MRLGDALHLATQQLQAAGVPDAQREAELLLAACLRQERAWIVAHREHLLSEREQRRLMRWLARRAKREPLAYITHRRWFYGIECYVARGVLVPRPETELLVEVFLNWAQSRGEGGVLVDAGTGSGCIAMACLLHAPRWRAIGIDRSRRALRIAMRNRMRLGLSNRWLLVRADWLTPMRPASVEAILANPPYVLPQEWAHLMPEITRYEPRRALLLPRSDPLRPYRQLAQQACRVLKSGGLLALETSPTLANRVQALLTQHGYEAIRVHPDLAGLPRVISAVKP
ncbi:MAG: peptide chain release factor N(5)-glutamine methyltransferase [Armatimonadota bacterium]